MNFCIYKRKTRQRKTQDIRVSQKNWTTEQIREYTELTDFKEGEKETAEIEDIDMQWTGFAKKK